MGAANYSTTYNGKEIQLYRYVYTVRNIELTLGMTNYTFRDGVCTYFIMTNDYLNRRFPVIQIGIEMDAEMIQLFFENKEEAKLKLDVYEQQLDGNDNIINTTLFLRHTFDCVSARDQTAYITTPDLDSENKIDVMRRLQEMELYLIDMEMVNTFAKEISLILKNVSKAAALQILFSERDVLPGIVIATPPQYEKTLDYISVPLDDLVGNIETINDGYGLYDSTPIIYYDYKYIYCLNSLTPNIIMNNATDFGNVRFMLLNQTNQSHNVVGSADIPAEKVHIINLQSEPEIYDTSERSSSTKFSTLLTVASDGTINQQTMDGTNTKIQFIREQNELTQAQYVNQTMTGHIVSIETNNCCVSFLKPYKSYQFQVDTQYADKGLTGHEYRLIGYILDIQRDKPDKYKHTVSIRLRKPFKDSQ